ncbi:hypothetical protein [Catenuloplanes japonicus]|uniref:hypothetical protein n=1 Tax=Catenuloplanes japonicus TaxID=33876 RepID=UPI000526CFB8|nr:hypothetical protein [Catenuloplanes japonicus]
MPHELVTHARHEAAYLGGQVRELLAWWLGISFGGLSATLGLLIALWPATVHMWGGVFVGMWLLGVAFCRVSDLLTDPPAATRRRRLPGWVATGAALLAAMVILRGLVGVDAPLAIAVTVVLSLIALADVAVAMRRGIRSRVGARAAVYLPAALATGAAAISGHLPAATVAVSALAIGIVEAATAATTGMKSLRWHAAARDAGLLTGEIRPFRESPGELRPELDDLTATTGPAQATPPAVDASPRSDDASTQPEAGNDTRVPAATGGTPLNRRPSGATPRSTARPAGRATINRPAVGRAKVTTTQE